MVSRKKKRLNHDEIEVRMETKDDWYNVESKWQGCGVGELLLRETMNLAANKGYKGILIFGEPDYYPRIGFKTCDNFNITTV